MPYIKNQYGARDIRIIPCLMLNGVVKGPRTAHLPLARFATDSEPASRRHDQWQMDCQARVGNTCMRRNMCLCIENRKKCRWPATRNIDLGRFTQRHHRLRAAHDTLFLSRTFVTQKVGAPAPRVIEFAPLIQGHTIRIGDIRLHTTHVLAQ